MVKTLEKRGKVDTPHFSTLNNNKTNFERKVRSFLKVVVNNRSHQVDGNDNNLFSNLMPD